MAYGGRVRPASEKLADIGQTGLTEDRTVCPQLAHTQHHYRLNGSKAPQHASTALVHAVNKTCLWSYLGCLSA